MATLRNLVVKITGDTSGLQQSLGTAQTKLSSSVNTMQKSGGKLQAVFAQAGASITSMASSGAGALGGLAAAAGPVGIAIAAALAIATAEITALKKAAQETMPLYQEAAEGETKLYTVMKQRMGATNDEVRSIIALANAQQQAGAVEGDAVISGQQQLATFLHHTDALATLTPALANLMAQQKGVNATAADGVTIGNMFGKVMQGQTTALKRVGISFTEEKEAALKAGNETQRAALLAQIITNNVGAMNTAMGATNIGALARLSNAWGDVKEQVGEVFTNLAAAAAPAIMQVISWLSRLLSVFVAVTKLIAAGWQNLYKRLGWVNDAQKTNADSAKDVAKNQTKVGTSIKGARKEAQKWLATFDQLNKVQKASSSGGSGGGIDNINEDAELDLGLGVSDLDDDELKTLRERILEVIHNAWEKLKEKYPVLADLEATWKVVSTAIGQTWSVVTAFASDAWNLLKKGAAEVGGELSAAWSVISSAISTAWTTIWNQVATAWNGVMSGDMTISDAIKSVWSVASSAISTAWSTITSQVKTSWSNIKKTAIETTGSLSSKFSIATYAIATAWSTVKSKLSDIWNKKKKENKTPEVSASASVKWSLVAASISNTWDAVQKEAKKALNRIIDEINKLVTKINNIKITIPWWLGGGSISLNIPKFKHVELAKGGIATDSTFAEIGEAGKEAVLPLEQNTEWMDELAAKIGARMPAMAGGAPAIYLGTERVYGLVRSERSRSTFRNNGR